jgi:exosortase E/protease (VPEID-CTERM system)
MLAPAPAVTWRRDGLVRRLVLLSALFSFELLAVTIWLDSAALIGRQGLAGFIGAWGAWILRGLVGFAALFLTFSWLSYKEALLDVARDAAESPVSWRFLVAHALSISAFALLSADLYGAPSSRLISDLVAILWLVAGFATIACGGFSCIRPSVWLRIGRNSGYLWIIALIAVILACIIGNSSRSLWPWAARITFYMARALVSPFIRDLFVNPARMVIGTQSFRVAIAPECSGLEGVGLMLVFGVTWLVLFRRQCRFPQALILLPAGAALIFLLNSVRIAALILIGAAGAERIALGGFHSQAGWIIFTLLALGFTMASSELPWLSKAGNRKSSAAPVENLTAAWLMPFVAILAAGMISRALTGAFEWLYPLRLFAATMTLFFFKRKYASLFTLDWRIDWFGPAIGIVVFVLWIGLDRFVSAGAEAMPSPLAMATPLARNSWLICRVLAAVVTVPVAEELAFRGFLYRRALAADFEAVSLRQFSWFALLVSSVVFGALHGSRWLGGTVAGGLYAIVMLRRGRIGDAIAAHATTNALIAVDVLAFHQWQLW